MTKIEIAKKGVSFVVGVGVSHIVFSIIDNNVAQETVPQKIFTFAGKQAIGMVVGEIVKERVNDKLDKAEAWWKENVTDAIAAAEAQS